MIQELDPEPSPGPVDPGQAGLRPARPLADGVDLGDLNGHFFQPNSYAPWGWGGKLSKFLPISSFNSFTPTIPWCQGGTWHQFSFRRKAAPELYGSSELGVLLLLYWRLKAGAPKKKDLLHIQIC